MSGTEDTKVTGHGEGSGDSAESLRVVHSLSSFPLSFLSSFVFPSFSLLVNNSLYTSF